MSSYTVEWCKDCRERTGHEDGLCMTCLENEAQRNREVLADLAEALLDCGIVENESCIVQHEEGGAWQPAVLRETICIDGTLGLVVYPWHDVHRLAPMQTNQDAIGKTDEQTDVWEPWDAERLEQFYIDFVNGE